MHLHRGTTASDIVFHEDVLRGSSRVPAPQAGKRDEPPRTAAWEATSDIDRFAYARCS